MPTTGVLLWTLLTVHSKSSRILSHFRCVSVGGLLAAV